MPWPQSADTQRRTCCTFHRIEDSLTASNRFTEAIDKDPVFDRTTRGAVKLHAATITQLLGGAMGNLTPCTDRAPRRRRL